MHEGCIHSLQEDQLLHMETLTTKQLKVQQNIAYNDSFKKISKKLLKKKLPDVVVTI